MAKMNGSKWCTSVQTARHQPHSYMQRRGKALIFRKCDSFQTNAIHRVSTYDPLRLYIDDTRKQHVQELETFDGWTLGHDVEKQ